MRLLLLVEASAARLLEIMGRSATLSELVFNGWLRLVAVDPASGGMQIMTNGNFEPYVPEGLALLEARASRAFYRGHREPLPPARIVAHRPTSAGDGPDRPAPASQAESSARRLLH